ncbi:YdjY domain-containing protein [Stieleria sp. ICT_E10.1]|uniref:YdjY domain-containing protein n=1 Tax=Stieleria sedimenti TaxID=2976331 RepID=UPI00217F7100|nr:YdjY domain-containing protein [Stieleria sedimenti]MCS7469027.1 YdjY domain-containing protein [Stieleria sedimenti]
MNKRIPLGLGCLLLGLWIPLVGCGPSAPQDATDTATERPSELSDPLNSAIAGEPETHPSDPAAPPVEPQPKPKSPEPSDLVAAPDEMESGPGRPLPSPPDMSPNEDNANAETATADAAPEAATPEEELPQWEPDGPTAEEIARKAFQPPPDAKQLSATGRLWIDPKRQRVIIDGYVALKRGALEMFACPVGTKEHESIVAALARSREVHAALLAVDATPGTPVRFRPEFAPPTGQVIRVWVCWYDAQDEFHVVDAREWVQDLQTEKAMTAEWVFAGSGFWQDEETKQEHYMADSGDMICVSNFSSAMLDVAIPSSADADSLRFVPFESKIPDRDTPVRLFLLPVSNPSDAPPPSKPADRAELPTARDVPRAQ